MRVQIPGRRIGESRLTWRRGVAVADGNYLKLDPLRSQDYRPTIRPDRVTEGDLAVDLANLAGAGRTAERDGIRFAERHGLLWTGPKSDQPSESFAVWQEEAGLLAMTLNLHRDLQRLDPEPTRKALRDMRRQWVRLLERFAAPGQPPVNDEDVPIRMVDVLTSILNRGLRDTQERVDAVVDRTDAHGFQRHFLLSFEPPHLLGLAYQQAALLVTGDVRMAVCADPKCARFFHQVDPRMRYCRPEHAARARQREYQKTQAAKRRSPEGGDE